MNKGVYATHNFLFSDKTETPAGCVFKPLQDADVKSQTNLQMCRFCYFYCNPYCTFDRARMEWTCVSCGLRTQIDHANTIDALSTDDVIEQTLPGRHPENERVLFVLTDRLHYALDGILDAVVKAPDSAEFLLLWFTPHGMRALRDHGWCNLRPGEVPEQPWLSKSVFVEIGTAIVSDKWDISQGEINVMNEFCDLLQKFKTSGALPPTQVIMFLEDTADTIERRFFFAQSRFARGSAYEHMADVLENCFSGIALSVVSQHYRARMVRLLRQVSASSGGIFLETPFQVARIWGQPLCFRDVEINVVMQRIGMTWDFSEYVVRRARATADMAVPLCLFSYGPNPQNDLFIPPKETVGMIQFVTKYTVCGGVRKQRVVTHRFDLYANTEARDSPVATRWMKTSNKLASAALLWYAFFRVATDETEEEMKEMYNAHLESDPPADGDLYYFYREHLYKLMFDAKNNHLHRFDFLQNSVHVRKLQQGMRDI